MADYTSNEIVDILLVLGECHRNYRQAAILYRERYGYRRCPNHTTIRDLELRARQGRMKRDRQKVNYDNDARLATVLAAVHLNPQISSRQIERQIGIPRKTALRLLKNAKYHAYHITLTQAITDEDMRVRLLFCQWAEQMFENNPRFFYNVMFSDEATFKNNGELNRHNCHYWSDVNPHWYRQIDNQHRWSVNVWCGIVNGYLIGPYFFEDTVNGENILQLLRDELPDLLDDVDLRTRLDMWVQLDGAGAHRARIVTTFLNNRFNARWIGWNGPVHWPPRSPDLTPQFGLHVVTYHGLCY